MANTIVPWRYTDDFGRNYVTGVNSELTTQLGVSTDPKIGGVAVVAADNLPPLPSSVRPRRLYMKNAAGKGRYVVCFEPTSELFSGVETTLNIEDSDGASTAYTRRHQVAERLGRSRV